MNTFKSSMAFAVLTVLISRLCCIVPFVAIVSGLTGGATMFSFLESWRPKPKDIDKLRPCCRDKAEIKSKRNRRFLWTTTVISVLLFSFPFYSHIFINATSAQTADTKNLKIIQLSVEGMSCQGCANNIMLTLSQTDGIVKDTVVFATKTATVSFDENKISSSQVIATIDNIGFTAKTKYKPIKPK
ncbi:MAG: heavy-metal-associated domain-containing protein [Bacteroidetes bacterium]|nr:heavy-metal-associated domain-containing protein [Bacteroidota bacterium]